MMKSLSMTDLVHLIDGKGFWGAVLSQLELDPMQIILCLLPCCEITQSASNPLTECPNNSDTIPVGLKQSG